MPRTRLTTRTLILVFAVAFTAIGCSSSGAPAGSPRTSTTAMPTPGPSSTSTTTMPGGPAEPSRAVLRAAAAELFAGGNVDAVPDDDLDCLADGVGALGAARLEELRVDRPAAFVRRSLAATDGDLEFAADLLTPTFDCFDMRARVDEQVDEHIRGAARTCVVDAVLEDRIARVGFVLGTTKGSAPDPSFDRTMQPVTDAYDAIVTRCSGGAA